jgi:2-oxoacid:acceptor oxidoreductase delta subunit (pyruvate/2-ketoisovalerate family)
VSVTIRRPDDVPDGTPMAVSLRSTRELATGSWRTFRPVYVTRPSPCNLDCPAGTDVRAVLTLAAADDAAGAWRTIMERNPLPGVCGRVCYHPCEAACNRTALDERVAVHAIERAIAAEAARRHAAQAIVDGLPASTGRRVAIVGSGPAGLSCAYHLARHGYHAVVFDGAEQPGGMLRYGIPAYRLPREVLAAEIDLLRTLGVDFRPGRRLGSTLTWQDLAAYDATFVAVGRQRSKASGVPGEQLAGVRPAIDFLREVNSGQPARVNGRVIVIGGGNTALDAARVALRQGAAVTILYRRSRREMPAHPAEIAQAELEGVRYVFHASPFEYRAGRGGALASIECQRMRPGAPDASGRCSPEPIPGDTFSVPCNHVLTAIGEELEEEAFDSVLDIARGRLRADPWGRTPSAPLFAGGDAATAAGTVVEAIGSGRRAAEAIHASLTGGIVPASAAGAGRVEVPDLNLFYFFHSRRVDEAMLHRVEATSGFREVVQPLPWDEATAEARRCLSCGACTECGNCVVFCPDAAVQHAAGAGFVIDYAHCKGCGICVTECPRGAMTLVPEGSR